MLNNPSLQLIRTIFAKLLTFIFLGMAAAILFLLVTSIVEGILDGTSILEILLNSVNTGIMALAVFELAFIIDREHSGHEENEDAVASLRKTVPIFIGTVCVAISLEGLIMVIKYSQLELAGNLYYAVAVILSSALLLTALGLFLFLTDRPK